MKQESPPTTIFSQSKLKTPISKKSSQSSSFYEEDKKQSVKKSSSKQEIPPSFNITRIKSVCNSRTLLKPIDTKMYLAFGKLAEHFLEKLGEAAEKEAKLKKRKSNEIGYKTMVKALENDKEFEGLYKNEYMKILISNICSQFMGEED